MNLRLALFTLLCVLSIAAGQLLFKKGSNEFWKLQKFPFVTEF